LSRAFEIFLQSITLVLYPSSASAVGFVATDKYLLISFSERVKLYRKTRDDSVINFAVKSQAACLAAAANHSHLGQKAQASASAIGSTDSPMVILLLFSPLCRSETTLMV
jgi:hypothetical protein